MNRIPHIEVVRDDPKLQADWDRLQARKRELQRRLVVIDREIGQTKLDAGAMAAEGCDYKEFTDKLADLRAEAEAIKDAIDYLDKQAQVIKRANSGIHLRS